MAQHSIWRDDEVLVDNAVDEEFSEPVEIHPWTRGTASSDGNPDLTREIVYTTGVYVMPGAAATGEAGMASAGLANRQITNDVWVSITEYNLGVDWSSFMRRDRIFLPERAAWFELSYITPSATGRPNLNLIRLQEAPVLQAPQP